ncbi:MAG: SLBB domain-containing protein [Chthonomonas sp.]|nr:SLBB domain-containing protein [Chthonomonas sp.]
MAFLTRMFLCLLMLLTLGFAAPPDKAIRANDKVKVVCEEEPALNRDYIITKDGYILMSFIGAIKVVGCTEDEAADRIEEELVRQRILRRATVTVTLLTSEKLTIRFSGAVKNAGELPWRDGLRVSDIVQQAKPQESADLERIRIESRLGKISIINYTKVQPGNNIFNPLVQPGDFVFFPLVSRETKAFILGAVARPGAIDIKSGLTLAQAIDASGGVLPNANPDRVKLTRAGQAEIVISLRSDSGIVISAGDRVVIEAIAKDKVIVVMGGVKAPGSFGFVEGTTLSRAIQMAGGLADNVKAGKVTLTRQNGNKLDKRTIDLKRVLDGFQGDINLQAGDRIDVPQPRRNDAKALVPLGILLFFLLGV